MATSVIQNPVGELVTKRFYSASYTLAANTLSSVSANAFGLGSASNRPAGYTPIGITYFTTGHGDASVVFLNPDATGTNAIMGVRNAGSASGTVTAEIIIAYIKTNAIGA